MSWYLVFSAILAMDFGELAGEAPSDMLVACLQLTCKNPLQPCVPELLGCTH